MNTRCKLVVVLAAVSWLFAGAAKSQDSPSLGDLARQQRQQKEQSKAAPGKDAKASKVITNEEIHAHAGVAAAPAAIGDEPSTAAASSNEPKQPAEHWKSQILAQRSQIAALQKQIDEINQSIQFAPANCVANCVEWNQRQQEKQQQVERMQAQLEDQQKRLEGMQDSARKQGYGSSVYDP